MSATRPDTLPLLVAHLRAGRRVTLRTRGQSMRPALREGDVVTVEPARFPAASGASERAVRVGDVVAAVRAGELRVHRVIELETTRIRLGGDALRVDDGWFEPPELLGLVCSVRRADVPVAPRWWRGRRARLAGVLLRALRDLGPGLRVRRTSDHLSR